MSHVREQIRDAVVTELKKITAFGNRVYPYRAKRARLTPYVLVITDRETVNEEEWTFGSDGNPTLMRDLALRIEVRDKVGSDLDGTMDNHAAEVEKKMVGSALASLAVSVRYEEMSLETADDNERLEQDAALMSLGYAVKYRTVDGSPETAVL